MLEATLGVLCFIGAVIFVATLSPKRSEPTEGARPDADDKPPKDNTAPPQ